MGPSITYQNNVECNFTISGKDLSGKFKASREKGINQAQ
jgi:hypothetical protein